jgi:creatinine amidohydrolase
MKVHVFNDVELTNGKYKGDHAGKYEISQMLYIAPQLVKMQRLDEWKKGELPTRFAQGEDASEASIELGKEIMEECLSGIHQILDEQTFQSPKPVQRTPMVYEQIEAIWKAIREDSINWRTNKINANQKKILDNSIWQPFEKGMVTGL